jgi:hypothetical protein
MSAKISDLPAKGSALASTDLIEIAEVSGGTYISKRVTGQNIIDAVQSKAVVVSTNQTAVNDGSYTVVANSTFTEPTPVEGKGYRVFVRNGTATINSVGYTVGTSIFRVFHSGAWVSYVSLPDSNFVPTTRTINGLDLSANRTLTAGDVGAVATTRNITINGTTQDLSADRTFSAVMLTGLPGVANTGLSGAVRYFAFSGVAVATSEITRRIIICNNMTLKNFYIYTSTAQPATGSHVLTILKNGVATSITITIASGSAGGLFSDTTNSESFAQGDAISIQAINNASTNSGTIVSFQIGCL